MQDQSLKGFRISREQRHAWALQQESSAYRVQCAMMLNGSLDLQRLASSLEQVVTRHEILRTYFYRPPGLKVPYQVITDAHTPSWRDIDLSEVPLDQQDAAIDAVFREESRLPVDVEQGPLLRFSLLTLSPDKHVLLISLPILCADTATLKNLVYELSHFYGSHAEHGEPLDEPLQYADFAEWQHEFLETEAPNAETGKAYWSKQNSAGLAASRLPFEKTLSESARFEPDAVTFRMGPEVVANLETVATRCNTSLDIVLLACWQTLLWRLTNRSHRVVGTVCDGRKDADLNGAMGPFAKYLPISYQVEANTPFSDMVERLHDVVSQGYEWQEYFAWDEELGLGADAINAFCGFAYTAWPSLASDATLSFSLYQQRSIQQRFKLQLSCTLTDHVLMAALDYDLAYFDRDHVQGIASSFEALVQDALPRPDAAVDTLALLAPRDRQHMLAALNATSAAYPDDKCLHELFEAQALQTPRHRAVVCGDDYLTYEALNTRANQLAFYLSQIGVEAGSRVGLCAENSVELLIGLLGILKAGGSYVPFHPRHPAARLEQQLAESRVRVVLTQAAYADRFAAVTGGIICLDRDAAQWSQVPVTNPTRRATPQHAAYVLYTSGSTGVPKGVVVSHRSVINYTHFICQRLGLQPADEPQFAMVSPITADLGNTCLFPALVSGGSVHLIPHDTATDSRLFADYVQQHAIDILKIVPSHLQALLAAQLEDANVLPRRYLILGGETLSCDLAEQVAALGSRCKVINHYGPTEATVGILTFEADAAEGDADFAATVPIGRPIANAEVYILDAHMQPVPLGVPGELYLGGAGLADGYLHRPELTAERFVPHPFSQEPGARLYQSGDLGRYLPNGNVEFLGRIDDQVKIRGFRVELREIEIALSQHSSIRQAVVVAHENESGHKRLVAYTVSQHATQALGVDDLRGYLQDALPDYMVPSSIIMLEALPLMANGKIDRAALPTPDQVSLDMRASYVAPRTPVETVLADIWARVLGREQVGIHDNFFSDLGGDSIISIQIIARANQAGLKLVPKQMFEYQTIAELASVAGSGAAIMAEQGIITGSMPLTPIQHWFFEQNVTDPHHWNQAVLLEVQRPLDPAVLDQVVYRLMAHHDGLRLRFHRVDSGWQQVYAPLEETSPFVHIDFSSLPEARHREAIEAAAAKVQASLDLSRGLQLRVAFFDLGQNRSSRLLIVVHHLVVDGVSWRILLEDLQTGYQQLSGGQRVEFPPKTTSFKYWATRLSEVGQSAGLHPELDYWLDASRHHVTRLPVDHATGLNTVRSSATVRVSLTEAETHSLLHDVHEAYHTQINDVLLTTLAQALARWTGSRSILVELEGHGREQVIDDVDPWRTMGWFTTHFPVLLDLGHTTHPGEALKSIKEQLRAIPSHGIGYGLLRYLSDDADVIEALRNLPPPEVSFNYLGQLDQTLPESSPFRLARESAGPVHSLRGNRSSLLSINGSVAGGQFQLTCIYSDAIHQRRTIESFAQDVMESLRSLIVHCQSPESGGYTPSDFSLAQLDEDKLSKISALLEEIDMSEEEAL